MSLLIPKPNSNNGVWMKVPRTGPIPDPIPNPHVQGSTSCRDKELCLHVLGDTMRLFYVSSNRRIHEIRGSDSKASSWSDTDVHAIAQA